MHLPLRVATAERAEVILILLTRVVTRIYAYTMNRLLKAFDLNAGRRLTDNDTIDARSEGIAELRRSDGSREKRPHRHLSQTFH